ncbi:uncharacterized protein L969DRAFT_86023 [Mixia osmundae IAM 14324]|uniref:Uncharacterized protein n=1 Tax=Mixia osmundae (strain CBS 9802 / IAM 14324 / JCM 22182 / KY 12970) TaxID=764103 RepID=G7E5E4_MIXOS|nr:uncharacterized protein L969DRAFT_86023 [Mixia osmundae IAM 14324]KEI40795.1 hypothetical protein L969DRAFT_86023 [Mixia osmundae IAM 14324]GAA98054.1 hypothetical protein E5Q_04735 [Mixia osmundae IAM 14324]
MVLQDKHGAKASYLAKKRKGLLAAKPEPTLGGSWGQRGVDRGRRRGLLESTDAGTTDELDGEGVTSQGLQYDEVDGDDSNEESDDENAQHRPRITPIKQRVPAGPDSDLTEEEIEEQEALRQHEEAELAAFVAKQRSQESQADSPPEPKEETVTFERHGGASHERRGIDRIRHDAKGKAIRLDDPSEHAELGTQRDEHAAFQQLKERFEAGGAYTPSNADLTAREKRGKLPQFNLRPDTVKHDDHRDLLNGDDQLDDLLAGATLDDSEPSSAPEREEPRQTVASASASTRSDRADDAWLDNLLSDPSATFARRKA